MSLEVEHPAPDTFWQILSGCLPALWRQAREPVPKLTPLLELYFISTVVDIYMRKITRQPLKEYKRQLLTILDTPANTFSVDPNAYTEALDGIPKDRNTSCPEYQHTITGEVVDNRTPKQKKQAEKRKKESHLPQQMTMFSAQETVQFGVKANPLLPLSPHMKLPMMLYDPRTEEEIERDLQLAAQKLNVPMFPDDAPSPPIFDSSPSQISG